MQIYFCSNLFTINNRVQETLVRFMVLHKKVCLELGREYFSISFSPASSLCGNPYSQSKVKEKLLSKREGPLPSFNLFFISVGKSPLNELKKKIKCILGTCRSGFGNGTSNEVGKGVKCVSGNFEETGNGRLEIRQSFTFYSATSACEYKAGSWQGCESEFSSQELS